MVYVVDFRKPETFEEVALFLGFKPESLRLIIQASREPNAGQKFFVRHQIPKKRKPPGNFRTVWDVADPFVRDAHRAFARRFGDFVHDVLPAFPHPSAFGYIRGRSIRDNAAVHTGRRMLLRCDLQDFFPSISTNRLVNRFIELGLKPDVARALADFSTIEGRLALGLNGSPMLANVICTALDHELSELAKRNGCVYTRYADDIAISGDTLPDRMSVADIVETQGFRLAERKVRITKVGQAHFVTGLSISSSTGPYVPRQFKRRVRQELYFCAKYGIRQHLQKIKASSYQKGINRIDGSVRFIYSIEPKLGQMMRDQWRKALAVESAAVSYAPVHDRAGVQTTFLIDEGQFEVDGQRFLVVGCVTTEHVEMIRFLTQAVVREHVVDPYPAGRTSKLEKHGLHFTEASESLRSQYVGLLPFLQFRSYLAFGKIESNEQYPEVYLKLLGNILPRRLRSYDRGQVTILIEQNSFVGPKSIVERIHSEYEMLESRNERRPVIAPTVEITSKNAEVGFSLTDAMLWVFERYFGTGKDRIGLHLMYFERLRDKYRHIVNVDSGEIFSRRHPIEVKRDA